ncbi:MAG: efflux RND transporter periplasmic adaptor subunit [Verrucomicrobiales bacterium]|nr:efflux RND transporter periplasmic adaptor subunit [Verrucomicrobiales bacterium]
MTYPTSRNLITGLWIALALTSCFKRPTPLVLPPPKVLVASPLVRDVPVMADAVAHTEATANVEVKARVEATVEKILYTEGSEVKEGTPLFVLDKSSIEQRLASAKGSLGQQQAALDKANQDVARITPLAKTGAMPQKDLDAALAQQQQAKAALETGKAQVATAELDLSYTQVAAPVTGVIGATQADVGALVGKGAPTTLATISPLDPIYASIEASEVAYLTVAERLKNKDPQNPATFALVLANGQIHPHLGKLAFMDRAVDATTGTMKFRVEFPNPEKILRPGQFCRVRIMAKTLPGALLLPQRAVQEMQGQHNVYVVTKEGDVSKVAFKRVKMGRRVGSLWVVESGLTAQDQVVTEGIIKLQDGLEVTPEAAAIDESSLTELLATVPGAATAKK